MINRLATANDAKDLKQSLLDQAASYSKEYLKNINTMPVWPSADSVAALEKLRTPLPETETDPAEVLSLLNQYAAPATTANLGGHYFGYVTGGLLPIAHAAQWLVDTWNQNSAMYAMSPAASVLEEICEKWVADLFGFPEGTAMSLVTGSSNGILVSLITARNELLRKKGWDVHKQGYKNAPPIRIVLGAGAHGAVLGALYYLGFGTDELEFVPIDECGRMIPEKVPALDDSTLFILQAGHVCGGAYDPIDTLVEMGNKAGAWVHVDGAFGLWAAVTPKQAHHVKGLGKASSCNFDAHKTLNAGYDNSIVLCRNRDALRSAMASGGSYLAFSKHRDGSTYATEMSRRARGIVLWAVLRQLGRQGLADLMDHLCECTEYFAEKLVEAGFEMPNPPFFNQFFVKCDTEEHTKAVLERIQSSGKVWSSSAVWEGETVMRMSVCSHMTTIRDIEESVEVYRSAYDAVRRESVSHV